MTRHRIFTTKFSGVYPHYVQKAERKGRTREEVDEIICWLTGYDRAGLQRQLDEGNDFETFFAQAPAEDPLMRKIRWLDKLIDELAKGRAMEKILRQ
jgi:hypothetical protein